MEPKYFVENRYSFVVDAMPAISNIDYEVETPETSFERSIQRQLAIANRLLMAAGKYGVALAKYRHLRGVIASVIHPKISVIDGTLIDRTSVNTVKMIDTLVAKQFSVFEDVGVKDREARIGVLFDEAATLIQNQDFAGAAKSLQLAVRAKKTVTCKARSHTTSGSCRSVSVTATRH